MTFALKFAMDRSEKEPGPVTSHQPAFRQSASQARGRLSRWVTCSFNRVGEADTAFRVL